MPVVKVTYALPAEQQAFEDAMLGSESVAAIAELKAWLREQLGSPCHREFRKALVACQAKMEALLSEPSTPADPLNGNDDEDEDRAEALEEA